jgi:hypothetical protein
MSFPNRPDEPDFWLLSRLIIDQDARAENDTIPFEDRIAEVVSPKSLTYMASQRALRAQELLKGRGRTDAHTGLTALWVDAFMAGAAYQAAKNAPTHDDTPTHDEGD